jgi:hypothetical protein
MIVPGIRFCSRLLFFSAQIPAKPEKRNAMLPNDEPDNSITERLKTAQAEVERLNQEARAARAKRPSKKHAAAHANNQRNGNHEGRVPLAPHYDATCFPDSLYATILTIMARGGKLSDHETLFADFKRNRTPDAARHLLNRIGVSRTDLKTSVRADKNFRSHCALRTRRLRDRAATGDMRANRILHNRKICDSRQRWIGDIDEAISILKGGRAPNLPGAHRNTQILRNVKLLFTTTLRNGNEILCLYPAKFYALFRAARTQAGE